MAYTIKGKRLIAHTNKEDFYEDTKGNTYSYDGKNTKKLTIENKIHPYASEVKSFANPETKNIMWIKREYAGKGWTNTFVNGKLVESSRSPSSSYKLIPLGYKEISLFSETSYHSANSKAERGKISNYGNSSYTLEYSDYKPIGNYKLESPIKTELKDSFGKEIKDVELLKHNYIVLDWIPFDNGNKFKIKHQVSDSFGNKKIIYESRTYSASEQDKAIKDFNSYVDKHKGEI